MGAVSISLPDGSVREYAEGSSLEDVAASISSGLRKNALAGKLNGVAVDLSAKLIDGAKVEIITGDSKEGLEIMRHSTAHLMAQAVKRLFGSKEVKLGVGPVIEDGFYYDMDLEHPLNPEDLQKIEKEMERIIGENLPISRREVSREEALAIYTELGDPYKLELIRDLPEDSVISIYDQGEFFDLCRGPHVPSTGKIKVFKLLSVAGAYWRGNSDNKMLQRIYGTAFMKKAELEEHLHFLEEAKKRDHRKLGKELNIFTFNNLVGQGLPIWLPKGATLRRTLERYIVDLEERLGYQHVYTPVMGNVELYKTSGHWEHYQEDMFPKMVLDTEEFVLRPMNCPHHMMVYKSEMHSYRDLPIRIAELGLMHRYEMSGALTGLHRVRAMTLNDSHIFCRPDQIKDEFARVIHLIQQVYEDFGIKEYRFRLSYRDPADTEKYFPDDEMWEMSQRMLREVVESLGLPFLKPKAKRRSMDRSWMCRSRPRSARKKRCRLVSLTSCCRSVLSSSMSAMTGKNTARSLFTAVLSVRWNGLPPSCLRTLPAICRFGWRRCKRRSSRYPGTSTRMPAKSKTSCGPPAFGRKATCATRSSGTKSARPSSRSCRTCLSSAKTSKAAAPYRCVNAAKATWAPKRSMK